MDDQEKQRKEDLAKEIRFKKIDEQLKVLADIKRYVFTTFLAVAVGIFSTDDELSVYAGIGACVLLFFLFAVLIIIRYRKIKEYDNGNS